MQHRGVSSTWLSDDMAQALTTMFPPLEAADVVQAADTLAATSGASSVVDQLLRQGADLMQARQIVEALAALHNARVMESPLPDWLVSQEIGVEADAAEVSAARSPKNPASTNFLFAASRRVGTSAVSPVGAASGRLISAALVNGH